MKPEDLQQPPRTKPHIWFAAFALALMTLKYFWGNLWYFSMPDFSDPDQWILFLIDFISFYLALSLVYFIVKRFRWRFWTKLFVSLIFSVPLGFLFNVLLQGFYLYLSNVSAL